MARVQTLGLIVVGLVAARLYLRRLRVLATWNGRAAGWVVEYNGEPVAILSGIREIDMFWDSYRFHVTTDDPALRAALGTNEFWRGSEADHVRFRSREFGRYARFAFGVGFDERGRLVTRSLHLPVLFDASLLDDVALWIRQRVLNFRRRRDPS